ncbi:hypothetical protein SUGI_0657580 [Cryptomeria japonica]|nr:hypothetical protein SUGI_0657580 [Cryptomeria japonica]
MEEEEDVVAAVEQVLKEHTTDRGLRHFRRHRGSQQYAETQCNRAGLVIRTAISTIEVGSSCLTAAHRSPDRFLTKYSANMEG